MSQSGSSLMPSLATVAADAFVAAESVSLPSSVPTLSTLSDVAAAAADAASLVPTLNTLAEVADAASSSVPTPTAPSDVAAAVAATAAVDSASSSSSVSSTATTAHSGLSDEFEELARLPLPQLLQTRAKIAVDLQGHLHNACRLQQRHHQLVDPANIPADTICLSFDFKMIARVPSLPVVAPQRQFFAATIPVHTFVILNEKTKQAFLKIWDNRFGGQVFVDACSLLHFFDSCHDVLMFAVV
jgi:hypothetical protein